MKGLLHSKRFRKNLYKWLFMYVGVMLLLTTVITYSKFMSSKMGDDQARVAKFELKINPVTGYECPNNICTAGVYRPTSKIDFTFDVDLTKLEVLTDLELYIKAKDNFELLEIKEITNNESYLTSCVSEAKPDPKKEVDLCGRIPDPKKEVDLCGRIPASSNKILRYKASVKYTGDIYEFVAPVDASGKVVPYNMISVGYTATQITTRNN